MRLKSEYGGRSNLCGHRFRKNRSYYLFFRQGCVDAQVGLTILATRCLSSRSRSTMSILVQAKIHISRNQHLLITRVRPKKLLLRACYRRFLTAFVSVKTGALLLWGMGFFNDLAALKALGFDFTRKSGYCKIGYIPTCTRLANGKTYLQESTYGAELSL